MPDGDIYFLAMVSAAAIAFAVTLFVQFQRDQLSVTGLCASRYQSALT